RNSIVRKDRWPPARRLRFRPPALSARTRPGPPCESPAHRRRRECGSCARPRKTDLEKRAASGRSGDSELASIALDEASRDAQTESGSRMALGRWQPHETIEHPLPIGGGNSRPFVGDPKEY